MYADMPSMEVQECPVVEVQRGHTHTQTFFQTIYNNPPEGEGSNIQGTYTQGFSKTPSIPGGMKIFF